MNHWECEAKVFEAAFMARRVTPEEEWFCGCAMAQFRTKKPFLPMLLTCKQIVQRYMECVESIYKSITFVFLDQVTLERFFGTCAKPTLANSPFLRYTPRVEISLPVSFTQLQGCSYNFDTNHGHWRPENFCPRPSWTRPHSHTPTISTVGENLDPRCEMVITSALSGGVGPEFGYLTGDDIFHPKVRVWKRYVGDLFLAGYGRRFPSLGAIVYSPQRYVAYVP
ncbi:unnamed protein product [Parascedosporium putredinis]|uniref:Uncharacterized protein n=1 Tax=Parascedosporium putredinis TaxID=1442378 RepID=A0A9P1H283_9PEZI|nr:unnamed protein product [Parascedosporium putredinis]CAI7993455.1 unnamed protein product [Parascedosporium putredinis]